jgi:hypothetical protein
METRTIISALLSRQAKSFASDIIVAISIFLSADSLRHE